MELKKGRSVMVVVGLLLVTSLAFNVYQAIQVVSLTSEIRTLQSEGTVIRGNTAFDEAALRIDSLANGTTVVFRNVTFTYVSTYLSNISNGTQWVEFIASAEELSSSGIVAPLRWTQILKAYWWCVEPCSGSQREAFTLGTSPIAGVVMNQNDSTFAHLLVEMSP